MLLLLLQQQQHSQWTADARVQQYQHCVTAATTVLQCSDCSLGKLLLQLLWLANRCHGVCLLRCKQNLLLLLAPGAQKTHVTSLPPCEQLGAASTAVLQQVTCSCTA